MKKIILAVLVMVLAMAVWSVASAQNGDLAEPEVEVGDKFYLGDDVTIRFGEIENAGVYSYWVHATGSDEGIIDGSRDSAGELTFSTNELWGSGTYWLEMDVNNPGYNEGHTTRHFALLDPDDTELSKDGIYFTVSAEEVDTYTDVHIIAYVPGAGDGIRLYDIDLNNESPAEVNWDEHGYDQEDGPGIDRWWGWRYAGQHALYIRWNDGQGWSNPQHMGTIQVSNPNGQLAEPEVEVGDKFYLGDDVTIRFGEIENAGVYSYWVHATGSDECIRYDERYDAGELTFSTNELWGSGTYWLEMDVNNPGYNEGHTTRHFALLDPNDTELSKDGIYFTVSAEEVDTYTDVHIIAYVPGAWNGIRVYDIDDDAPSTIDWEEYERSEQYGPGLDTWGNWRYAGDHKFYVSANGGEGWSEPQYMGTIHVSNPNGQLAEPEVEVGDKFYLGDDVTIRFGEIENAGVYSYWVHATGSDECIRYDERYDAGELTFSTNELWGSGTYWLEMDVNNPGYNEGHTTRHFALLNPDDTELSKDGIYFTVSAEEVDTYTDVHIIAYVPGAWNGIRVYDIDDDDPSTIDWEEYERSEQYGPGLDTWGNWRYAGDHKFYVSANGGEGWSEPQYMGTIHVSNPNGQLAEPEVEVGDKFYLGDDVTITFSAIENAGVYSYWVHATGSDECIRYDERYDAGELTFSTNELWGSGTYWLEMDVNNPGYNEGHTTRHFALLDPDDTELSKDGIYFTVSAEEVDTYTDVHIIAYVPGAWNGIRVYDIDDDDPSTIDWEEYERSEQYGPGLDTWGNWRYAGDHKFYVSANGGEGWSEPQYMGTIHVNDESSKLILPAFLNEIGEEAFAGIAVRMVVVPDGCTSIGSRAFANCPNLVRIVVPAGIYIADDAFEGSPKVTVVTK